MSPSAPPRPSRVPVDLLRCPETGAPLTEQDGELRTADGTRRYRVADGVPVLVVEDGLFSADAIVRAAAAPEAPSRSRLRALSRRLEPTTSDVAAVEARFARFATLVKERAASTPARVLVVGGGLLGHGMGPLAADPGIELLDTDVYLGGRAQVVCDGHRLPFADGTFDGVVVQAVLEHVADPPRVVAEIHRVLRPGAPVFAETPLMYPVHEGAFDFTRWTDLGHRRLFRMFAEVDRGVVAGPGVALWLALRYFARALPRRRSLLVGVLDRLVGLSFSWLVLVDRRIIGHAGAYDAASGVYFLGLRAETPIDDADLVQDYRGAFAREAVRDTA